MDNADNIVPPAVLRTMQIIAGALIAGLVTFLAIVLVLGQPNNAGQAPPAADPFPLISLAAAAWLFVCIPLSIAVPAGITKTALRQIAAGTFPEPGGAGSQQFATAAAKLLAVRQTTMIISQAMLEGAGFFGCIAYMLEHRTPVLAVPGAAILVMLLKFPTEGKVSAWLERQAQALLDLQRANNAQGR